MRIYNKINNLVSRILTWLKSKIYVLDLRLQGATVPWSTVIAGRVIVSDAQLLTVFSNVSIGKQVRITTELSRVQIGENTQLSNNVSLDAMGGGISIGSNVLINTFTIITAWSGVTIGDDVLVAPFCHITDRNHGVCKNKLIRDQSGISRPIYVNDDVWIGSSCVILQGVQIGNGAVVGANSVVNKSIDNYTIVAGTPARMIGKRE